jgi:GntR family transcriptional regulator
VSHLSEPGPGPRLRSGGFTRPTGRSTSVRWVCDVLRAEVVSGRYADDILPSEDALIRRYGTSRGVIRQVLLVLQGVIERVRGAGTFVVAPSIWLHQIEESRDLAQEVNAQGTRVVIRKVHVGLHRATDFLAEKLGVRADDDLVLLETATYLDGFPLSMRTAFLPAIRFARLVSDPNVNLDRSPYEVISEVLGERVGETELHISSSTADRIVADELNVPVGTALLDTTRVIRDVHGAALEYSIAHARGDRLVFTTLMRIPPERS